MADPLSAYLWPQIRNQIPQNRSGWAAALASEFNRLCGGPSLYDKARFAQVALRKETRLLLAQNPQQGDDLRRLNRMLLEDGYSGHIAQCLSYMGGVAYQPAVLAGLTPGRVDIFWSSCTERAVKQTVWDGSKWSTYKIADQYLPDGELVAVSGLSSGRIDLFCLRAQGNNSGKADLDHLWWDGGSWQRATIVGNLSSDNPPAAVYNPEEGRIYVFWAGSDDDLWTISTDGTAWTTPEVVGMISPVAISGFRPGRMDVIWGGIDKQLKQAAGDGTTWNSVRLNPGRMAAPAAVATTRQLDWQIGPDALEFFWTDEAGAMLYEWFDGNWHIEQIAAPGSVKSPPVSYLRIFQIPNQPPGTVGAVKVVCWVNNDNQLCEATLWPGLGWRTHIFEFTSNPAAYGVTGLPVASTPEFSSHFPPAYPVGDYSLFVCDAELKLWQVMFLRSEVIAGYSGMTDAAPVYFCYNLNLGPVAYAPSALMVYKPPPAPGTLYVFWCAKEDKSLKQSWEDQDSNWHTVTIDPGPLTSTPAIYHWQIGEPVHMFWRGRDGSLQHKWASAEDMGETYRAAGWQIETIAPGPVYSDPYAVNNGGKIYVFWLDSSGKLQQTSQSTAAGQSGWSTINIAPATNDGSNFRDL